MPERLLGRLVLTLSILMIIASVLAIVGDAEADVKITTPTGTVVERVKNSDAEAVAEAIGRAEFMKQYAMALSAPTVTSQCVPSVITVKDQEMVVMGCSHQFFDPSRLKVPAGFMDRRTSWADVTTSFVKGVAGVATAVVGAAPYAALAYGINQTRKAGQNGRVYNDSFNTDSRNQSNNSVNDSSQYGDSAVHDLSDNSDASNNSQRTVSDGSVSEGGQVGDTVDSTHEPTVVTQPQPIVQIVPPEVVNPVVVEPVVIFPDP